MKNTEKPSNKLTNFARIGKTLAMMTAATVFLAEPVLACTMVPPITEPEPPKIWIENHGDENGITSFWIGLELPGKEEGLFSIDDIQICDCGLAFFPEPDMTLPSISVKDAMVAKTNIVTHEVMELLDEEGNPIFDFDLNSEVSENLTNDAPMGGEWSGLRATVNPFDIPNLGDNEVFKLWFEVEVPTVDVPGFNWLSAQFAAGSNLEDHPIVFTDQVSLKPTPEPTAILSLLGLGGMMLLSKKKQHKSGSKATSEI
ncbi:MAG: PEP-CTERM sorting domain-containing protein [Okeania sp. SIO2C9]|uniref:PEP-CTERM sorting domain-containing protein n=1 Tax=Okeania sp. SIO2C9 TaxID=2607791 RepID=UPI0013C05D07|nr:PEP-CTERM sorting domain-containing protein [Okeania sp. SIO2C9]NEQ76059.1 PEP-CTERM sorting domain-containing protein [Okeania sp. SIO2C9]